LGYDEEEHREGGAFQKKGSPKPRTGAGSKARECVRRNPKKMTFGKQNAEPGGQARGTGCDLKSDTIEFRNERGMHDWSGAEGHGCQKKRLGPAAMR